MQPFLQNILCLIMSLLLILGSYIGYLYRNDLEEKGSGNAGGGFMPAFNTNNQQPNQNGGTDAHLDQVRTNFQPFSGQGHSLAWTCFYYQYAVINNLKNNIKQYLIEFSYISIISSLINILNIPKKWGATSSSVILEQGTIHTKI